jgi:hypothetical protein
MPDPRRQFPELHQLLWHGAMGMVLGILCAGILLVAHAPEVTLVVGQPTSVLARFIFLVSVGLSCGLGAALTGAMFMVSGEPGSAVERKSRFNSDSDSVTRKHWQTRTAANHGKPFQTGLGWVVGIVVLTIVILTVEWNAHDGGANHNASHQTASVSSAPSASMAAPSAASNAPGSTTTELQHPRVRWP